MAEAPAPCRGCVQAELSPSEREIRLCFACLRATTGVLALQNGEETEPDGEQDKMWGEAHAEQGETQGKNRVTGRPACHHHLPLLPGCPHVSAPGPACMRLTQKCRGEATLALPFCSHS